MDLSSRICVGLGGNCDCRCGILYAPMFVWEGVIYVGLVSLTSSPYSLELFFLVKISLKIARKMMMRSQHHHAV